MKTIKFVDFRVLTVLSILIFMCAVLGAREVYAIEPENIPSFSKTTISYDGGQRNVPWDEEMFVESSFTYSRSIAKLASVLSAAAYNGKQSDGSYIYNAYRSMGILDENISLYSYPDHEANRDIDGMISSDKDLAFSIASKEMDWDTVLLVTLRGTDKERAGDILKDLDVLKTKDFYDVKAHAGFYAFYEDVMTGLQDYLTEHPQIREAAEEDCLKVLITGHSLGAAAANLVGENLNCYDLLNISSSDMFVYTFASPNVYQGDASGMANDANIHNIINTKDPVPKLLTGSWKLFGEKEEFEDPYGENNIEENPFKNWDSHGTDKYISAAFDLGNKIYLFNAEEDYSIPEYLETDYHGRVELPIPSREDYDFSGWYTGPEGGDQINDLQTFEDDTVIYAHWSAIPKEMTTYDQVIKNGNTVYCAGAAGIYKAKVKGGKLKSKKLFYKTYGSFGAYSHISAMSLNRDSIYFIEGTEGTLSSIMRKNTDGTGKGTLLDSVHETSGYAISDDTIYYDTVYYDDYDEPHLINMRMALNGSSKQETSIGPAMTRVKTNENGYTRKIKVKGKYCKDYLVTPKGTFYLGKSKRN